MLLLRCCVYTAAVATKQRQQISTHQDRFGKLTAPARIARMRATRGDSYAPSLRAPSEQCFSLFFYPHFPLLARRRTAGLVRAHAQSYRQRGGSFCGTFALSGIYGISRNGQTLSTYTLSRVVSLREPALRIENIADRYRRPSLKRILRSRRVPLWDV